MTGVPRKDREVLPPQNANFQARVPLYVSISPRPILSAVAADFLRSEARLGCTLRKVDLAGKEDSLTRLKVRAVGVAGVGWSEGENYRTAG